MSSIELKDVVWVGFIALGHGIQQAKAAREVGNLRRKHKISPPEMNGPPEFIRALRAQQNCLEFGVPFQIVLWTAGIFAHQVPAAVLGAVYVYSRSKYFKGYVEDADKRIGPFWVGIRALQGLTALAIGGLVNVALKEYADINVVAIVKDRLF